MAKYSLYQVDAFTTTPLGGNPCAVVFDCQDLKEEIMLQIAQEMNLSETAFVWKQPDGNFRARYFTPVEEIPLAGHPTIATIYALVDSGRLDLHGDYLKLPLELRDGPIDVEIFSTQNKVDQIVMTQRKPQFLTTYPASEIMPAFGLEESDLMEGAHIQTVSTGTPMLMVPIKSLDALKRARLDIEKFAALQAEGDYFSPHLFCTQGVEAGQTFARQFGLPPDVMEDPFTGSATGSMSAFLWRYGWIPEPKFIAEQGHWIGRPGKAFVEVVGPRDAIETVKVGGSAVTVLRGELSI